MNTSEILGGWYPLVPDNPVWPSVPAAVSNILQANVYVRFPASCSEYDNFYAYIADGETEGSVIAGVSIGDTSIVVPLVKHVVGTGDASAALPIGESCVIMKEDAAVGGVYALHPNVVHMSFTAPKIYVTPRTSPTSEDGTHRDGSYVDSGVYGQPFVLQRFLDGNNVHIAATAAGFSINVGAALGTGRWTSSSPFSDVTTYPTAITDGLRSINGVSGDVKLESAAPELTVTTGYDPDRSGSLTVRIFMRDEQTTP